MAPLLARVAHHGGVLLANAAERPEEVSTAGNKVVHQDSAGLIMFAGMFALPFIAVLVVVFVWVSERTFVQDIKDKVMSSRIAKKMSAQSVLSPSTADEAPSELTVRLEELHETGLKSLLFTKMNIMLVFVPLGFMAHFLHWGATTTFLLNMVAMLPLAGLMGVATEELACHTGQTVGGLLNATFGNAVELIFVVQSLRSGLITVTKGTLLGSILANELLVLGMALFFGGLFDKETGKFALNKTQHFSFPSAMIQSQMLLFSSFLIVMPSMFEKAYHIEKIHVLHLSRMGSVFALGAYFIFLIFQLYTHSALLRDSETALGDDTEEEEEVASVSAGVAAGLLTVATLLVAICSEFLVHGIDGFAHAMGFSQTFIGVILLPIIGNACEHSTAVLVALKDKVTLSIGIAVGSTIQVALFVVPFAVLVGWMLDQPMDLNFGRVNSWALVMATLLVMSVLVVGRSTWINGFVLISAYGVLAFLYFLSPDDAFP